MFNYIGEIVFQKEIIIALIGVSVAGVVSSLPKVYKYIKNIKRKSFIGEWFVYSHSGDPEIRGVNHKIKINVSFANNLVLSSFGDAQGYKYQAIGKVIDSKYFVGEWYSKNPGSHSKGTFMIIIEPQGKFMTGYYSGTDIDGKMMYHPWVFAREENNIQKAINWLKTHTFELTKQSS